MESLPKIEPSQLKSVVHVAKSRLVPPYFSYPKVYVSIIYITSRCAFVNFKDRSSAERAAEAWANGLDIGSERVGVKWGRSKAANAGAGKVAGPSSTAAIAPVAS